MAARWGKDAATRRGAGEARRCFLTALATIVLILSSCLDQAATATTNWLVVLAAGSSGEAQAKALPAAPGAVTATCNAPTTSKVIKVTWSAVTNATNYAVYQATSTSSTPGTYSKVTTVTTTSWTSGTLTAGTNYWYEVVTTIGTNWAGAQSAATGESTINSGNPYCTQP